MFKQLAKDIYTMLSNIQSDTMEYLDSDKPLSKLVIEYKNSKIELPIDFAEINNYISEDLKELADMINEEYVD